MSQKPRPKRQNSSKFKNMVSIDQIKKLREETGISISECKKALEEAQCDSDKAKDILKKWGKQVAAKKGDRIVGQGIVDSYIHPNRKIGVLLEMKCESDFVAKSDEFRALSHELCLQFAAMGAETDGLLAQPWIKDPSKTVKNLLEEAIAKIGENIVIGGVARFEI